MTISEGEDNTKDYEPENRLLVKGVSKRAGTKGAYQFVLKKYIFECLQVFIIHILIATIRFTSFYLPLSSSRLPDCTIAFLLTTFLSILRERCRQIHSFNLKK